MKDIHNALLTNTRVYAAAEKYDIPELKELAHQKFMSRLCMQSWPYDNFHLIVCEVILPTPANDAGVRDTVLSVCADAVEEITGVVVKNGIAAADWAPVLREDPDFLLEVLQRATSNNVRTATKTEEVHTVKVAELRRAHTQERQTIVKQSDMWQDQYVDSRKALDTYKVGVKELLGKADLSECPSKKCSKPFQPIFEEAGTTSLPKPYVLKCRKCRRTVR